MLVEPVSSRRSKMIPFLESEKLRYQKYIILPTSHLNKEACTIRNKFEKIDAQTFYLCLNFEVWLDHTDEIMKYKKITEVFKDKWNNKYSTYPVLKESYKNSVTMHRF